jgi:hypothetical protein
MLLRSAHSGATPLQNVATSILSSSRGKHSTRSASRRTIQTPLSTRPESRESS